MQVIFDWCPRRTRCIHCDKDIAMGEPRLVVQRFSQKKRWRWKQYFHPACWMELGLFTLSERPKPVNKGGGRKGYGLTTEQKVERNKLMQRLRDNKAGKNSLDSQESKNILAQLGKLGGIKAPVY